MSKASVKISLKEQPKTCPGQAKFETYLSSGQAGIQLFLALPGFTKNTLHLSFISLTSQPCSLRSSNTANDQSTGSSPFASFFPTKTTDKDFYSIATPSLYLALELNNVILLVQFSLVNPASEVLSCAIKVISNPSPLKAFLSSSVIFTEEGIIVW